MKFNYDLLLCTLCLPCVGFLYPQPALSGKACEAGTYAYLLHACHDCPTGCYCEGGKGKGQTGTAYVSGTVEAYCRDRKGHVNGDFLGIGSVKLCPDAWPSSDKKTGSVEQCYKVCAHSGGKGPKIHNKKIHCDKGYYLPYEKESCASCKNVSGKVCPSAIDVYPDCSKNQGLQDCPSGEQPNADRTACIKPKYHCDAGQYLPKNATTCKSCKSRYYLCVGGDFTKSSSDQGIRKCDGNLVANSSNTKCETDPNSVSNTIHCDAGQYLPKNTTNCKSCKSRYYLCIGGDFTKSSSDQGIRKCDGGLTANESNTACTSTADAHTIHCDPGQYVPKNATTCSICDSIPFKHRSFCPGGTFEIPQNQIQGVWACDNDDEVTNETRDGCVKENANNADSGQTYKCNPGQYLPANSTTPKTCVGAKKYCPGGGEYSQQSFDQGIFDCPLNGRTNSSKSACTITLTKDQLRFGPNGTDTVYSRQCWQKYKSVSEFKTCIFGARYYK